MQMESSFVQDLAKCLQTFCARYVEYETDIKIIGHLFVSVDSSAKNYFVNENLMKQDGANVHIKSKSFAVPPTDLDSKCSPDLSSSRCSLNEVAVVSETADEESLHPLHSGSNVSQTSISKEHHAYQTTNSNSSGTLNKLNSAPKSTTSSGTLLSDSGVASTSKNTLGNDFTTEKKKGAIDSDADSTCSLSAHVKEEISTDDEEDILGHDDENTVCQEDNMETEIFNDGEEVLFSTNEDKHKVFFSESFRLPSHRRFGKTTEIERDSILNKCDAKATKQMTQLSVNIFKSWLKSKGESEDFETWDEAKLNNTLEIFYTEVRRQNGKDYSKSTLIGIRAGLNRHLMNPPFRRNINIIHSPNFASSARMLYAVVKNISLKGEVKKIPTIAPEDLSKLRETKAFNINDPLELQQKVFFDIAYEFQYLRRDLARSLTKTSFVFKIDNFDSKEYCELNFDVQAKGFSSNASHKIVMSKQVSQTTCRLYATGEPNCPIFSLKKYLSKLDPCNETFFVKHRTGRHFYAMMEDRWYTTKPLGINHIGRFMTKISMRLNLSCHYTNHSIRATRGYVK